MYASRVSSGRIRIGVEDPAQIVERLEVFTRHRGERALLTRAGSEAAGRNEYLQGPGPARTIWVEALMRVGADVVIVRTIELLADQAALPGAPVLQDIEKSTAPSPKLADSDSNPAVPWWWIVAVGVAAGAVGASVWQESRF